MEQGGPGTGRGAEVTKVLTNLAQARALGWSTTFTCSSCGLAGIRMDVPSFGERYRCKTCAFEGPDVCVGCFPNVQHDPTHVWYKFAMRAKSRPAAPASAAMAQPKLASGSGGPPAPTAAAAGRPDQRSAGNQGRSPRARTASVPAGEDTEVWRPL